MTASTYSNSFLQNLEGFIWFKLDDKYELVSLEGSVEEITGYSKNDFLFNKVNFFELVIPEYKQILLSRMESLKKTGCNPDTSIELEYRIKSKDGSIHWIRQVMQLPEELINSPGKIQGFLEDITEIKKEEEILKEKEQVELIKFHNIIKKNLEIVSVLLTLQAEKFTNRRIIEAFSKSQTRIASIRLIHEELYNNKSKEALNISDYLEKLACALINAHILEGQEIKLNLELESAFVGIDKAIPLGIIVNELITNSLKHAFPAHRNGEIQISFHKVRALEKSGNSQINKISENKYTELQNKELQNLEQKEKLREQDLFIQDKPKTECLNESQFVLTVSDNGIGFPEKLDFKTMDFLGSDSLGLQIINSLVEQIEGTIELRRNKGTGFIIKFCSDI
ncbi:MAG: histidine kinase dimerization/phosphoacceptor domain -containing protein [Methanosarcina sp.]